MLTIICVIVAVVMIMVFMGASVLESEHIKRHPPNDDGCRPEGKGNEHD